MTDPFVDSKLLGRPPRFGGEEAAWEDWSFTLRAYTAPLVGALGPPDGTWSPAMWMDAVELLPTEVDNATLSTQARTFSSQLYLILAMLLHGPPLVVL